MNHLIFAFMSSLLIASSCLADQMRWHEIKSSKTAMTDCGDGEKQKIYAYQNSSFHICYFDSADLSPQERAQFSKNKIQLKESYSAGFKKFASSNIDWFANEGEVGTHKRSIVLQGESVMITEDDGQGHSVLSRTITCHSKDCSLGRPVCVLKSTSESKKALSDLQVLVKKTKSEKIWDDYFDGKKIPQGQLVIDEAILGSKEAQDLIKLQPGDGSASGSEIFATIQGNIDNFRRYCAPAHETQSKYGQRIIDCLSKKTPLSKTICASPDLRKLDENVNALFDGHSEEDRNDWYQVLDTCRSEVACLKKEYGDEIFRLKHD